ncbi:MAG: SDR family NAD(P)-dependent oxidoreductase [Myxococcales bacterium]|nr:SDR family NAD(P)-dependent oxidoreductase [Myxococcales bacterium]
MTASDGASGTASAPRTVVVTGASSGIGAAIARGLGELGFRVALGARRIDRLEGVAKEVETAGGTAFAHALDVADPASVDAFFRATESALGAPDAVVNNAGLDNPVRFAEADPEDFERIVAVNLLGPMYTSRRAVPAMIEAGAGDLLFVSSHTVREHRPAQAAYGATKAGLEHLARTLALEFEGSGIRSTIIRVGATQSEFHADWTPDQIVGLLEYWKKFGVQRHLAMMPPESVARAVGLALTTPQGAHLACIEVLPEAPAERNRT